MEHTHLVKGLDFALLQKVKSEIERKTGADGEGKGHDSPGGPGLISSSGAKKKRYSTILRPAQRRKGTVPYYYE